MEVYKRAKSPCWYVDLVHPGTGERRRQSLRFTGTKVQAQKRANELEARLHAEATQGTSSTLREAVEDYLGHLQSTKRLSSWASWRHTANKLFGLSLVNTPRFALDGSKLLHELTPSDVERLVRARQAEGKKPQTIASEVGLLRTATRYAAGLGKRVPSAMLDGTIRNAWRIPQVTVKTRWLTWDEWTTVYEWLEPGDRKGVTRLRRQDTQDLLVALTMCGGRWQEVASLTWDRVDLTGRTVRIWGSKVQRERMVPLPDQFAAVLWRRWEARDPGNQLVFPTEHGTARKRSNQGIPAAFKACGINRPELVATIGKATVHSLRHTFASWCIQNGADLSEVRDALGHSSIVMTQRYASLSKEKTVAKLGGILSNIGGTA